MSGLLGASVLSDLLLGGAGAPEPSGFSSVRVLRTRPPLDLNVLIETPSAGSFRWGWDDPNPANTPQEMTFSSAMPGGFERFSATLQRNSRFSYPDLAELAKLTVMGLGGDVAWQGRLEKFPAQGGSDSKVTPEAVGYQAALEDDNSAREVFVDRELSRWEGPQLPRQLLLAEPGREGLDEGVTMTQGAVSVAGASDGVSALLQSIAGAWGALNVPVVESWYDAQGVPIALIYAAFTGNKSARELQELGYPIAAEVFASPTNTLESASSSGNQGLLGTAEYFELGPEAFWMLRFWVDMTGAGVAGVNYELPWERLAVYGNHGLPLRGSDPGGVFASDVIAYSLRKWAPELAFTTGAGGTIQDSSFVIPQLAFLEPTTDAEIIKQATRFDLEDWAVWEGPTFYMNPRGERGRKWRARSGPAQLQQAGPQVSRLWNGVVVAWQDVSGVTRTVGPKVPGAAPGTSFAGATEATERSGLYDVDPENPLNKVGIRRWSFLKMGTSTIEGAAKVGEAFLREQALLETSGQAALVGYVEDSSGIIWPAWKVRAGDEISFIDAADPSYRRIVKPEYSHTTKTCTIQLDQPPEDLQAILERLSVVLVPAGFS